MKMFIGIPESSVIAQASTGAFPDYPFLGWFQGYKRYTKNLALRYTRLFCPYTELVVGTFRYSRAPLIWHPSILTPQPHLYVLPFPSAFKIQRPRRRPGVYGRGRVPRGVRGADPGHRAVPVVPGPRAEQGRVLAPLHHLHAAAEPGPVGAPRSGGAVPADRDQMHGRPAANQGRRERETGTGIEWKQGQGFFGLRMQIAAILSIWK